MSPDNKEVESETPSLPSKLDGQAVKTENITLEAKLENNERELEETKQKEKNARKCYTVANLSDRVICMETKLPNKGNFQIVVSYVQMFKDSVNFYVRDVHFTRELLILLMSCSFFSIVKLRSLKGHLASSKAISPSEDAPRTLDRGSHSPVSLTAILVALANNFTASASLAIT